MKVDRWLTILQEVAAGELPPEEALETLRTLPYEDLSLNGSGPIARLDHHRGLRTGIPEVVFGQGKTPAQIAAIVERLAASEAGRW
jgi:NCAIR mutase (PurE)-related protein